MPLRRPEISRGRFAAARAGAALLVAAVAAGCGRAADAGEQSGTAGWSAPAALPAPAPPARAPVRVAGAGVGADGAVHILYRVDAPPDSREPRLYHAARGPDGDLAPVPLDGGATRIASPRLVVDGKGRVHAVWIAGRDPRQPGRMTLVEHRMLEDEGWSPVHVVYRESSEHGIGTPFAALGTDAAGRARLLVARTDSGFVVLTFTGNGWDASTDPAPGGGYAAWNAAGGAHADFVYVASELVGEEREAVNDVWYRPASSDGWGPPVRVHGAPGYSLEPQLATDGTGTRHAVWREGASPTRTDRLLHATAPPGGEWGPARAFVPASAGAALFAPVLAVDGRGAVHLVFLGVPEGGEPALYHARRVDGAWEPLARFAPEPRAAGGPVSLSTDPHGAVHAVWRTAEGGFRHATYRP